MSAPTGRPFGPDELLGAEGPADPDELAAAVAMALELEFVAAEPGVRPSPQFIDRVSGAIAREPRPAPAAVAREAIRRRSPLAFLGALRDAGRVAFGSGRPVAVRGQAFALLLAALAIVGSTGGVTALAASRILSPMPEPSPTVQVATPSPSISPTPTVAPLVDPAATPPTTSVPTARPSRADGTTPTDGATPTDSHGSQPSPSATDHPRPTGSPHPTDGEGDGSGRGPGSSGSPGGGGPGGGYGGGE